MHRALESRERVGVAVGGKPNVALVRLQLWLTLDVLCYMMR